MLFADISRCGNRALVAANQTRHVLALAIQTLDLLAVQRTVRLYYQYAICMACVWHLRSSTPDLHRSRTSSLKHKRRKSHRVKIPVALKGVHPILTTLSQDLNAGYKQAILRLVAKKAPF